jgi:hypothetical protein
MALSVADIQRWDAEALRDVFHAANGRGQSANEASDGLAQLPVFATWGGAGAEAAKAANGRLRVDLDAHSHEAFAVASAASEAADGVEKVKRDLQGLETDAAHLDMESSMPPMEVALKESQLQPRLNAILAEANTVDAELAQAINMADGKTPITPYTSPGTQAPAPGSPELPPSAPNEIGWGGVPPAGRPAGTGQWIVDTTHAYPDGTALPGQPPSINRPLALPNKLAVGPSTGLLSSDKTGFINDADSGDLQRGYHFRVVGVESGGQTKMVQIGDKWYQAQWLDYKYEMKVTKVLQGTGDLGGVTTFPITTNWQSVSIADIRNLSNQFPAATFYLPDTCGNSLKMVDTVIDGSAVTPVMVSGR